MADPTPHAIQWLIRRALAEDAAFRDITSHVLIPRQLWIRARIVANARGVAAGIKFAALTFTTIDASLRCHLRVRSGQVVTAGTTVLTVEGCTRSIFAAERTALNVLGHLSGIATLTRQFVRRIAGTQARIYDTRKTLPGLRALEKYAVRAGGGHNHRMDLSEAILIKTNHLRALGRGNDAALVLKAVACAKRMKPRRFVEIEVTNFSELKAALTAKPDAILLDNWTVPKISGAVRLRGNPTPRAPRPAPLLEVSGGVTLANVRAIAKTGVDRISIGRLTHSAPSLDVSLEVVSCMSAGRGNQGP